MKRKYGSITYKIANAIYKYDSYTIFHYYTTICCGIFVAMILFCELGPFLLICVLYVISFALSRYFLHIYKDMFLLRKVLINNYIAGQKEVAHVKYCGESQEIITVGSKVEKVEFNAVLLQDEENSTYYILVSQVIYLSIGDVIVYDEEYSPKDFFDNFTI